MKEFKPPLSHMRKVAVTTVKQSFQVFGLSSAVAFPLFLSAPARTKYFHAQNCNTENRRVMLYRGLLGEPVQNSKSAAQFLAYFCFKNHHKLKAKGRIRPNKNASCCPPQVSLRSCSINRLSLPNFGKLKSLGYGPPCASYFFFVGLLLSSGLQFTKHILWPART